MTSQTSWSPKSVLVTGGGGYVGAILVPKLLNAGYRVKALDLFIYGDDFFDPLKSNPKFEAIKGDIRDQALLKKSLRDVDVVIHLACISNDPSFDLNPTLGRSINLDAFRPLVEISREAGVKRFIYASSSSVYGIKDDENVHEDMTLEPLTDYSKFKAECEKILAEYEQPGFTTVTVRPATVCGYSPRQRFDLIVNILTNHAYNNRKIKVFGGSQKRPNLHIEDMTDLYLLLVRIPSEKVAGKVFNAGYENHSVDDLARLVQREIGPDVAIEHVPTDDNRSYHVSSAKIERELGFKASRTIVDAVRDIRNALQSKKFDRPMENKRYYNIKTMLDIGLE